MRPILFDTEQQRLHCFLLPPSLSRVSQSLSPNKHEREKLLMELVRCARVSAGGTDGVVFVEIVWETIVDPVGDCSWVWKAFESERFLLM